MLARLETIDGVEGAEVDHRGKLLRLRLHRDEVLGAVRTALGELGYRADDIPDDGTEIVGVRWYGATQIGDLSREEAEVIARRVTPAIAREHGLDTAAGKGLERTVAEALYGCFITHTLGAGVDLGTLRTEASRAVDATIWAARGSRVRLSGSRHRSAGDVSRAAERTLILQGGLWP